MKEGIIIILLFFCICFVFFTLCNTIYAQQQDQSQGSNGIILSDPKLKLELVTSGLDFPTTMEFLGPNDFLILEKSGTVKRVTDGQIVGKPLLHVDVNEKDERGLLGIAVSNKREKSNDTSISKQEVSLKVFLYYITCEGKNADCKNQIYRYDLDNKNNALINPKLLLSIPSFPDPAHIGGIIDIGPDNNLYFTIGNFQHTIPEEPYKTKTQNFEDGKAVDGRAGILRITQDGKPVGSGILGNEYPLNLYYAYGVKNSFGLDFDPVTGKLWYTENGPRYGDEINLAEPGSNSGSDKIFGIWRVNEEGKKLEAGNSGEKEEGEKKGKDAGAGETKFVTVGNTPPKDFVYFEGRGHYSPPKFTWDKSSPPTGLLFLNSAKLDSQYKNDMFVGSVDGRIFHFDLNDNRTELFLKGVLQDKIATDSTEYGDILFAEGFSIITDLKQGPDGYLYVVSGLKGSEAENPGAVYRIVSK
ncbi:MAG TPA: PQQ-dependent sugar dehydrogenase [Nitrososphaeraceae archaeon]|nr:PQQ-dependent sugar dehydrogenase [Nitrososphaeraceae archaeon]